MLQQLGSKCTTVAQVTESKDKVVFKAIQDGINRYNTRHIISDAQKVIAMIVQVLASMGLVTIKQVQKWTLLGTDFTIPGGELGMSLYFIL